MVGRQEIVDIAHLIADGMTENDLKHGGKTQTNGNERLPVYRRVVFVVTDPLKGKWFGWILD